VLCLFRRCPRTPPLTDPQQPDDAGPAPADDLLQLLEQRGLLLQLGDIVLEEVVVGTGGSGVVQQARWQGALCAAKRLHRGLGEFVWSTGIKELRCHAVLRHPNVVPLLGVCYRPEESDCIVLTEVWTPLSVLSVSCVVRCACS
jgi:hypothetical protein